MFLLLLSAVVGASATRRYVDATSATPAPPYTTWATPCFSPLVTGIPGRPGTSSYTDTNAVGTGVFFYRVGVED